MEVIATRSCGGLEINSILRKKICGHLYVYVRNDTEL